mmetsp:Transcript_37402/g.117789  ORF Transcript_37402/g.117789 Transcript_37402/m.117789 type:complete len:329 (-) Transcript_37402:854-1840(-)
MLHDLLQQAVLPVLQRPDDGLQPPLPPHDPPDDVLPHHLAQHILPPELPQRPLHARGAPLLQLRDGPRARVHAAHPLLQALPDVRLGHALREDRLHRHVPQRPEVGHVELLEQLLPPHLYRRLLHLLVEHLRVAAPGAVELQDVREGVRDLARGHRAVDRVDLEPVERDAPRAGARRLGRLVRRRPRGEIHRQRRGARAAGGGWGLPGRPRGRPQLLGCPRGRPRRPALEALRGGGRPGLEGLELVELVHVVGGNVDNDMVEVRLAHAEPVPDPVLEPPHHCRATRTQVQVTDAHAVDVQLGPPRDDKPQRVDEPGERSTHQDLASAK